MNYKFSESVGQARTYWDKFHEGYFDGMFMTIEEFKEQCEHNYLIDYDGYGDWVVGDMVVDGYADPVGRAHPSDVVAGKIPEGVTHVIWYNK